MLDTQLGCQDQNADLEKQIPKPSIQEPSPMEKLSDQVKACLDEIVASNSNDACIAGLEILHKLTQNILKEPSNDKFRVIKRSNKAVATKLLNL